MYSRCASTFEGAKALQHFLQSDRALNCKIVNVKARESDEFEICIQDMQWLQWLAQHLQIVKHNLLENSHTISGLGRYANSLRLRKRNGNAGDRNPSSAYSELSMWVAAWKEETDSGLNSLHMLMHQVQECTRLVRCCPCSYERQLTNQSRCLTS
jgi:hypothetical protein